MNILESRIRNAYWLEIDKHDKDCLHDTVFNAINVMVDDNQLRTIFNKIPFDDILDALKWGFGDTEVRGSIYTYIKANKELFS